MIYKVETTDENLELNRGNVENLSLRFVTGLCAVNPLSPSQPRDSAWYLTNVIEPMIEKGELSNGIDGPFDDRKFRFSGARVIDDVLEISLGVTHFFAFQDDLKRPQEENKSLQQRGLEEFGDRYIFFSRVPGVAALVISSDGSCFVGERTNQDYTGFLNSVGGHIKYRNLDQLSPREDVVRETWEEFGITPNDFLAPPLFVGLYGDAEHGDSDFTFLLRVQQPAAYFTTGTWKQYVKEKEHSNLLEIADMSQVKMLLDEGRMKEDGKKYEIMYSTRGALESICAEDLAEPM